MWAIIFGEKKIGRVRETMRKSCGILGCYGIGAFLLMLLGAPLITGIFTSDEAVIGMGGHILRIFAAGDGLFGDTGGSDHVLSGGGEKENCAVSVSLR